MLATIGLAITPRVVRQRPESEKSRWRAHSTDTVTSVHSTSELNTRTSESTGIAASPSVTFVSGIPSSTVFAKMPPIANTDWLTPSMRKSEAAAMRPIAYTTRQPPKNARSRRASTGGSREKSLISRNSSVGTATLNTNRVSASEAERGQPSRVSAKPRSTSRNSGAVRLATCSKRRPGARS